MFSAVGGAVFVTKFLIMAYNALLIYLSKTLFPSTLLILPPRFPGNTCLFGVPFINGAFNPCLGAFAPVLSAWEALPLILP